MLMLHMRVALICNAAVVDVEDSAERTGTAPYCAGELTAPSKTTNITNETLRMERSSHL